MEHRAGLGTLVRDLVRIFGSRLDSVVAYGRAGAGPQASLVLVSSLATDDLDACAARTAHWRREGAATPLLVTRDELSRSLDAFPIEYSEIIDTAHVLHGSNPFAGSTIHDEDVRRACEVQVKSHLLHLRENYLEIGGRHSEIAELVRESAPSFALVLRRLARLDGDAAETHAELDGWAARRVGLDARVVGDLLALSGAGAATGVDAHRLFPDYLRAVEALARFVDAWRRA
jgi:hypothetical protein